MLSCGQKLFKDWGISQAACFSVEHFSEEILLKWTESFAKPEYRNDIKKIRSSSVLMVISQNCDIAARNDESESCIELVICKKIREKDLYPLNQFVRSTRLFQFSVNGSYYQASSEYILTIEKSQFISTLSFIKNFQLLPLEDQYINAVPLWRANRYSRIALPDKFNEHLLPCLSSYGDNLTDISRIKDNPSLSYIRAIYIYLNTLEEASHYHFELFALMHHSTPDEILTQTQNHIEELASEIESKSGFKDESELYADRENNTYVSYLTRFAKLNLDYISLSNQEEDVGPELPC